MNMKNKVIEIAMIQVTVSQNHRKVSPARVSALVSSIVDVGLLHPIGVTKDNRLVYGRHRFEAYRRLNWKTIPAVIIDQDALHIELATIDENLMRANLTKLEESQALARRKEIYEAIHPETKHGGDRKGKEAKSSGENRHLKSFSEDTAEKTGKSARQVRDDVSIAEKLPDEIQDAIADTPIADNKSELHKLARQPEERQKDVADLIVKGEADSVGEAVLLLTQPACPNCGAHEFDDDGSCAKCHEPDVVEWEEEEEDASFDGPEGIEKVIAVLTAEHLNAFGGYPYDWTEHAGKVFIASLDDSKDRQKTQIDEYDSDGLREWEKRAKQYHAENPEESWSECVFETQPDEV